jgi:hypothetical protein
VEKNFFDRPDLSEEGAEEEEVECLNRESILT